MKDFRQKEVKSKDNSKHGWNVKQDLMLYINDR